jgi:acyl-CoA synthetase (AMP-forming)/AMP-acid ligase II
LQKNCDEFAAELKNGLKDCSPLIFLKAQNSGATLTAYLTCLQMGLPLLLLDPDIQPEKLQGLVNTYQPNCVIEGFTCEFIEGSQGQSVSSELALMLSTSGSTGSAKQVCLSANNLNANALSICEYLPILASDKTITTLPFFYSYGLSVINSHLLAGACIVFCQDSVISREFWRTFKQHNISSFAGVPYTYEMLMRLRFERMALPSLRYFTQAGGKLNTDLVKRLAALANEQQQNFYVMYGQTEATARMAFLASDKALLKPDSIGQAIPNGQLNLRDEQGNIIDEPNQIGELVYVGPNIMLGYAESREDLVQFESRAQLATGDIAYRDQEGDYFIQGRIKRFIKLFGQRINLDEVEQLLAEKKLECYCTGDDTKLIVAVKNHNNIKQLTTEICQDLKLHHSVVRVMSVVELPLNANGKKDYQQVLQWATEQ